MLKKTFWMMFPSPKKRKKTRPVAEKIPFTKPTDSTCGVLRYEHAGKSCSPNRVHESTRLSAPHSTDIVFCVFPHCQHDAGSIQPISPFWGLKPGTCETPYSRTTQPMPVQKMTTIRAANLAKEDCDGNSGDFLCKFHAFRMVRLC